MRRAIHIPASGVRSEAVDPVNTYRVIAIEYQGISLGIGRGEINAVCLSIVFHGGQIGCDGCEIQVWHGELPEILGRLRRCPPDSRFALRRAAAVIWLAHASGFGGRAR